MTLGGITVQSRFLQYRNGYNELETGSLWYDNSVVYLETETDRQVIYEDQNLVTGGGKVRVTALQNAFQESGTRRQTVELFPVENASFGDGDLTGQVNVGLPTRLNSSYWDNEIPTTLRTDPATTVNESAYPAYPEVYRLELTLNANDLRFNTIGINAAPKDTGESLQQNVGIERSTTNNNNTPPPVSNNLPGGEPVVGNPTVAFDDSDDDGELDNNEQTYTKDELYDFDDDSVNLVVPQGVGQLQQNDDINIRAKSITSEVRIRSQAGGAVELRATEGEILLTGRVESQNDEVEIYGKRVTVSGDRVRADNGGVTISATVDGGGELTISSGTEIRSQNDDIILESVGDMTLDGATLNSQNGEITADLGGAFTLSLSGTDVRNQNGPGTIQYTPSTVTESPERAIAESQ